MSQTCHRMLVLLVFELTQHKKTFPTKSINSRQDNLLHHEVGIANKKGQDKLVCNKESFDLTATHEEGENNAIDCAVFQTENWNEGVKCWVHW